MTYDPLQQPAQFLRDHARQWGEGALRDVTPLALAVRSAPGYQPTDDAALYEPSMMIYPIVNPVLAALLVRDGATPTGAMTFTFGLGDEPNVRVVMSLVDHVAAGCVQPHAVLKNRRRRGVTLADVIEYRRAPGYWIQVARSSPDYTQWYNRLDQAAKRHGPANPFSQPNAANAFGVVSLALNERNGYIRVYTNDLILPEELTNEIGPVDLNLRPAPRSTRRTPALLRPAQVSAIAEWAAHVGFPLVDADESNALALVRHRLAHSVVAWSRPGRPAQAQVSVGALAASRRDLPRALTVKNRAYNRTTVTTASRLRYTDAVEVSTWRDHDVSLILHPAVADTAALAAAVPVDDDRLFPHQREAVGRHLATTVGYANVCSPGAGKTVMVLDAMRRRAHDIPSYRGLIIAEANVRRQFADEVGTWFPEARLVVVEASADAPAVAEALHDNPTSPLLVLTSYAHLARALGPVLSTNDPDNLYELLDVTDDENEDAPTTPVVTPPSAPADSAVVAPPAQLAPVQISFDDLLVDAAPEENVAQYYDVLGAALRDTFWHDIVADEAACLRNPSSRQSRALWHLREHSGVAVALTGTPIARDRDDLGRILSWVRNDKYLFYGAPLTKTFDLASDEDLYEFHQALGPIVFRCDKSEFADQLPTVAEPLTIRVTPTPAEAQLADVALRELRRVYDELVTWVEAADGLDHDSPEYRAVAEQLRAARHAWTGGTTIARLAASDPASLRSSTSSGVALLDAQGLIDAATQQTGSKRRRCVEETIVRVAAGERILIFTEFSSVAKGLLSDLRAAGLRVGEILGGGGKRRDAMIDQFRKGQLDVMVATSAGERGLNLQTATTLIHFDLPWSADSLAQRHGRIERIGATAKEIQILFLITEGTIEERVAALVAARSVEATRALDLSRGVDIASTDLARTLSGLINAADETRVGKHEARLLEFTRELIGR